MTAAERRERGTLLCRRLADDAARIAPEGIGGWDRTWDIVADADSSFVLALTAWEATGAEKYKPALRQAYFKVLEAWRQATAEFEQTRERRQPGPEAGGR